MGWVAHPSRGASEHQVAHGIAYAMFRTAGGYEFDARLQDRYRVEAASGRWPGHYSVLLLR